MINPTVFPRRQMFCLAAVFSVSLFYSGFLMAASVKVAFTGDQGAGEGARAVLSLIANEGADLLLIQGDLGYDDGKAAIWEQNLTQALGADFPVLTVVGNHENFEWPLYNRFIQQRIDRVDGLSCSGNTGVKALCRFGDIEIVQVSPGIHEVEGVNGDDDYAEFIKSSFAGSTARWRICAWHKNQSKMQTGRKGDATGWGVYDACLNAGAMIALAHEHAYSRTHLLSDFENQKIVHKNSELTLEPGKSFAVVSGLGGHEIREQMQGGDWWSAIYTASQGAAHGALFCTFEETTADCYFKAIDGAVPDQFSLKTGVGSVPDPVAAVSRNASVTTESSVEQAAPDAGEAVAEAVESANPEILATENPTASASASSVELAVVTQDETAGPDAAGPLTVVSSQEVITQSASALTDSPTETVATVEAKDNGASAGEAGSFSLFLLLALAGQFGLRKVRFFRIR